MTRKQMKKLLECFHMLLIFAMIIPVIYMVGMQREGGMIYRLYWVSYLLFVPFMGFKIVRERCKKLWKYLLSCVGIAIVVMGIAILIKNRLFPTMVANGYLLYILLGIIFSALKEYAIRIKKVRRQKAKEEMDRSWREIENFTDKPNMKLCFFFVVIYVVSLDFACPEVCDLALFSTVFYLVIAIAYQYIETMEHYLAMNEGVCEVRNIPYKRLFGIGKVFLLSYMILILLAMIPAWMTVDYRQYKDYREWVKQRDVDYEELFAYEQEQHGGGDPMQDLIASYGSIKETPMILKVLIYVLGATAVLFMLGLVIRWIYGEIKDFARNVEEEDDKVEMLEELDIEEKLSTRRFIFQRSEDDRIRNKYRRFIKKHRKDRPAPYETPEEIELAAGVADTMEGKELHNQYEKVRYGR